MKRVQCIVNDELRKQEVYTSLCHDRKLGGFAFKVVPESLLGALWLQFALAVAGNKKYRACGACGQWFEVSPDVARTSRSYCKEACRARAYRARKDRAQAMAAEGKSIKQIAEELGSDEKTVTGWLLQNKE